MNIPTKPQFVIANSTAYLATVEEKGNKTILNDALALGAPTAITKNHLQEYIVATIKGSLSTVKISGDCSVSSQDLDKRLSMSWDILVRQLAQAEEEAPGNLVADAFTKLSG